MKLIEESIPKQELCMIDSLKEKKTKLYKSILATNKNNLKNTWSIIIQLLGKLKSKSKTPIMVHKVNEMLITDDITISNHFNHYL